MSGGADGGADDDGDGGDDDDGDDDGDDGDDDDHPHFFPKYQWSSPHSSDSDCVRNSRNCAALVSNTTI